MQLTIVGPFGSLNVRLSRPKMVWVNLKFDVEGRTFTPQSE